MSYYNTTALSGEELRKAIRTAKTQTEKVKSIFELTNKELTPFEVAEFFSEQTPITSIRRAITNLTKDGYLVQTDTTVRERYGSLNYRWKIA